MQKNRLSKIYLTSFKDNPSITSRYSEFILGAISFLNIEYPDFYKWYQEKVYKGLFLNEREVVAYLVDKQLAAISILKKSKNENKISTIRVIPKFRYNGLGKIIIEDAIAYLDDEKPSMSVPEKKIAQFSKLINRYGFRLTDINGKYNRIDNREFFFN